MTLQLIDLGAVANDYQGDPLRTGGSKINDNFTELYRPDNAAPILFGTGAPSLTAAKGTLYINLTGSDATSRAFINTNGTTGWTYLTAGS